MKTYSRYNKESLKKLKTLFFFIHLVLFSGNVWGQNQFDIGQYMFYQPIINPATSGSYQTFASAIYCRKQWASIEGAPTKFLIHALQPINKNSISGSISQESIGVHSRQKLMASYAYRVNITLEHYLSMGFSAGVQLTQSKYTDIESTQDLDDEFQNNGSYTSPDFNFGLYYFNKRYYLGFSIPSFVHTEINTTNGISSGISDFRPLFWNYYLHGGFNQYLSSRIDLNVSALTRVATNTPVDIDINLQLLIDKSFGTGISFRTKKEVLLFINARITNGIMMGYSYHTYFGVKNTPLSAHEIILTFNLNKKKSAIIQTPRF